MATHIARLYSAELEGIDAKIIEVEADINIGLHQFNIVGLADKSLNEARERVNSALKNSGIKPPARENRKITINLAPADIRKTGSHYDLAIALGYLLASGQIKKFNAENKIFLGELALDGRLRPVNGALNIAQKAAEYGFEYLILPEVNANEAAAIRTIKILPVRTFVDVIEFLDGRRKISPATFIFGPKDLTEDLPPDLSEIKGQEIAKRALMIAAAGQHNILMAGPPGVGKSFLARALKGILPDLTLPEAIETTKIWSAAGMSTCGLIKERPFRAPHQTASTIALVGGGNEPKPGEVSLAHNGILFLDELPEFHENTLESLRQPIEAGVVHIARAKQSFIFPARFSLVAAMNPCPCGYYGDSEKECICSAYDIIKYRKRISGPLLDRIDIRVKLGRVTITDLRREGDSVLSTPIVRQKVSMVREIQSDRFRQMYDPSSAKVHGKKKCVFEMTAREIHKMAALDPAALKFLKTLERGHLSPRGYLRLLKVARTIADLDEKENTSAEHLAEAYGYRIREEPE